MRFHSSKDGGERAGAQSAMGVEHLSVLLLDAQRGSHIAVAAMLQVGLEEQALHLTAFGLLLGFDLVEGQLESTGGGVVKVDRKNAVMIGKKPGQAEIRFSFSEATNVVLAVVKERKADSGAPQRPQ